MCISHKLYFESTLDLVTDLQKFPSKLPQNIVQFHLLLNVSKNLPLEYIQKQATMVAMIPRLLHLSWLTSDSGLKLGTMILRLASSWYWEILYGTQIYQVFLY